MFSIEEADGWIGRTAVDSTGEQVGMITQIWVDDASGEPEWASIKSAVLGWREALVPLAGSADLGGGRQFAYTKKELAGAPHVAQDGHLDPEDRDRVSAYYDVAPRAALTPAAPSPGPSTVVDDAALLPNEDWMAPTPTDDDVAPAAPQSSRRFGRKPKPSAQGPKRRFGRKPASSQQQPSEVSA